MLFEKMNAAMRHSAEEGKKRRELDAQKNGGMRAELARGDVCAMLISAFLTIVQVVGGLVLLMGLVAYVAGIHLRNRRRCRKDAAKPYRTRVITDGD